MTSTQHFFPWWIGKIFPSSPQCIYCDLRKIPSILYLCIFLTSSHPSYRGEMLPRVTQKVLFSTCLIIYFLCLSHLIPASSLILTRLCGLLILLHGHWQCNMEHSGEALQPSCFTLLVCLSFSHRQPTLKGDEKPVASVRPVQSTPIPMMPRHVPLGGSVSSTSSTNPSMNFPINYLQRAGVLVQKVVTTTGKELLSFDPLCDPVLSNFVRPRDIY